MTETRSAACEGIPGVIESLSRGSDISQNTRRIGFNITHMRDARKERL